MQAESIRAPFLILMATAGLLPTVEEAVLILMHHFQTLFIQPVKLYNQTPFKL